MQDGENKTEETKLFGGASEMAAVTVYYRVIK